MADMQNVANVRADMYKISIGTDEAPHDVGLSLAIDYAAIKVFTQRKGKRPIDTLVGGLDVPFAITFEQSVKAEMLVYLGITAGSGAEKPLAVGAAIPTKLLRFHHPNDSDDANDIVLYAAVFTKVSQDVDGDGVLLTKVEGYAQEDSNGDILRIGAAT